MPVFAGAKMAKVIRMLNESNGKRKEIKEICQMTIAKLS